MCQGTMAFGPVPSRRLGQSLGINNIPPKICTYSCVYCQIGRTHRVQVKRRAFYKPEDVERVVCSKVSEAKEKGKAIDYLTFVPDGEATLDVSLGREMEFLKGLGINIAVISNASLIWHADVQEELLAADWISLKLDAASEALWRRMNRPHRSLRHDKILRGMSEFSALFKGELVTETMFVQGMNEDPKEMEAVADIISSLEPRKSYISIPTRPPAENWVKIPSEDAVNQAYQIFTERGIDAEYNIGYEGNEFASTGDLEEDLLSITSVHPMRGDAVREFLAKAGSDWQMIEKLLEENRLVELEYGPHNDPHKFYLRRLDTQNQKR